MHTPHGALDRHLERVRHGRTPIHYRADVRYRILYMQALKSLPKIIAVK